MFLFDLPLTNPVPVFGLLLSVVLLIPLIFKKLKIPGIVGLILAGVLIGPHGLGIIERDESIVMLGTIGLLYIMFLAGLDLDLNQIKNNRSHSILFGAATFFIPLTLGMIVSYYILDYNLIASLIISLMFSTHTLVAYPIASRLGLTQTRSITTVIGGTIITDTAVLVLFGITVNYAQGNLDGFFWFKFLAMLALFIFAVLWLFPKIARWFFKNIEEENYSQFIFIFAMFLLAGVLAELAGVEPIIGAFFAGLAFNKLIPHNSALMNRIHFIGSGLFIPLFLISVGMIIDLSVLLKGYNALFIAGVLTSMALVSKWAAAQTTRILFDYSRSEAGLIFGLSSSHAAATIAVILIGYNLGVLDINALNATILLILITCLVSSFVTERAGRKLAIEEQSKKENDITLPLRILVPCSNPTSIDKLLDLAVALKEVGGDQPIFPLSVVMENEAHTAKILNSNKAIETFARLAYPNETKITPTSRLDTNIANGIIRAVKEMMITVLILGWTGKSKTSGFFFGRKTDNILEATNQTVMIAKLNHLINISSKVHVYVPENAEFEVGFKRWLYLVDQIGKNAGATVVFYGNDKSLKRIIFYAKKHKLLSDSSYNTLNKIDDFYPIVQKIEVDDILFIISSRTKGISYSAELEILIDTIAEDFEDLNFILLYPEISAVIEIEEIPNVDVLEPSFITENINLYQRLKKLIRGK